MDPRLCRALPGAFSSKTKSVKFKQSFTPSSLPAPQSPQSIEEGFINWIFEGDSPSWCFSPCFWEDFGRPTCVSCVELRPCHGHRPWDGHSADPGCIDPGAFRPNGWPISGSDLSMDPTSRAVSIPVGFGVVKSIIHPKSLRSFLK